MERRPGPVPVAQDARAEGNRNTDSIRAEMLQSETRLRSLLVASQREGKKW